MKVQQASIAVGRFTLHDSRMRLDIDQVNIYKHEARYEYFQL